MINIKAVATATDGSVKRIAITYDIVNDEGKITLSNAKLNRGMVDTNCLEAISTLEEFATKCITDALGESAE